MKYKDKKTTIQIDGQVREALELYKINPRETLNEVLKRILHVSKEHAKKHKTIDVESLIETIEVLQDPQLMRDLQHAMKSIEEDGGIPWEQVKKECGL